MSDRLNLRGASLPDHRDEPNKVYPSGRVCATPTCPTILSIYNPEDWCYDHRPDHLEVSERVSSMRKEVWAGTYDGTKYVRHGSYWARTVLECPCAICAEGTARAIARASGINKKREEA